INKNNLSFILKEVKVPGGKGTFWVNGGYINGGEYQGTNYSKAGGADIGFMHNTPGDKNNNQFSFQSGFGACTSLSTAANIPTTTADKNSWTIRLTDMLNRKINDRLDLQAVGVYQFTDTGYASQAQQTWASLGIRPVVGLTKHLALEFEPGIDYINSPRNNYDTFLAKVTAALRLAPGTGISSHPRFRLYATFATWGNDFKNYPVGGEGFRGKKEVANFGVQAEQWW
ncbi:MAG: carbohydrate porin, partial [Candidatus Omnitrophota bacterium]